MPRPSVLAIPERLDAFPGLAGRGVCMAFVDLGFYPHPDLMRPVRRVRAYADVTRDDPRAEDLVTARPASWHGTMTACCAAGNGHLSGGRFRGLASEAEVVLVKVGESDAAVRGRHVASAIRLPLRYPELGIRVLSVSLGVSPGDPDAGDVEAAVDEVVASGVVVVAAAGNRPNEPPEPPGSAAAAITVGGLNDKSTRDESDDVPWPSSFGQPREGVSKPDLLAPAMRLPAPMLPGTYEAREAAAACELLAVIEEAVAARALAGMGPGKEKPERGSMAALIEALELRMEHGKYLGAHYQHVDGTSFAAPVTASVVAQMLEARPALSPAAVREGLLATAQPLAGVSRAMQGAGVLRPREAVEWALRGVRNVDAP